MPPRVVAYTSEDSWAHRPAELLSLRRCSGVAGASAKKPALWTWRKPNEPWREGSKSWSLRRAPILEQGMRLSQRQIEQRGPAKVSVKNLRAAQRRPRCILERCKGKGSRRHGREHAVVIHPLGATKGELSPHIRH